MTHWNWSRRCRTHLALALVTIAMLAGILPLSPDAHAAGTLIRRGRTSG